MRRFTSDGSVNTLTPATRADPPSAFRRPSRISTVVVFPAPFGPRRPNTSPDSTWKLMPRTASISP